MTETENWLTTNMTFVFNWDPKHNKMETFSFLTADDTTGDVTKILDDTGPLSDNQITSLKTLAKKQSSRHTYYGCDDVFEKMHLILNTALCGDWAGSADKATCESKVAQRFGAGVYPPVETIDHNPVTQAFWNVTSTVSKGYSWDIEEMSYRAYV